MLNKNQKTYRYKKQTVIKGKMGVPPWNDKRQMSLGVKSGLQAFNLTLIPSVPYKTNSVNKSNPSDKSATAAKAKQHVKVCKT